MSVPTHLVYLLQFLAFKYISVPNVFVILPALGLYNKHVIFPPSKSLSK